MCLHIAKVPRISWHSMDQFMKRICLCIYILPALLSNEAHAATTDETMASATNALSLIALVSEALEKNPELNFYRAEISAAKAGRRSAGLLPNPELSAIAGHKTAQDRTSGLSAEGMAWSVSVVQPFEWPGRIGLRKAIANRDIELAELGYERFKVALAARVRSLAYGLFAAQQKAAVVGEVAERFKALREVLVQREPAGLTPMLETRVIEAIELTMQHKASDAGVAAKAALFELNQLRGVPPDAPLSLQRTSLAFRSPDSMEALVALARTNNFELRLRAVELAQQGFRVALAKNERFPAISLGPTITEETALERERVIGLGVSFPLPLWNRNTANIDVATARQAQAEVSFAVAQRDIERKVMEAVVIYETKLREMSKWRADAVDHFREAADLADRHYRLGAVQVSVYIELQKQYLEAVESLLDTQREALEASQSLELLTGLTPSLATTKEQTP
jgi:cobalt-zinc-cadmium efflux system outer membrane protein